MFITLLVIAKSLGKSYYSKIDTTNIVVVFCKTAFLFFTPNYNENHTSPIHLKKNKGTTPDSLEFHNYKVT